MRSNRSAQKDPVEGISLVASGGRVQGRRELGNPGRDHHHHYSDEMHPRRSSLEPNSKSHSSRPSSRGSQHNSVLYETISLQQSAILDTGDAVINSTHAQNQYYQDKSMPAITTLSPKDQLAAPFLNQNFEKKKKKKKFPFGKK